MDYWGGREYVRPLRRLLQFIKLKKKKKRPVRMWCKQLFHRLTVISSVQSLSRVRLLVTPWTAGRQASLSITISRNLLKLMSMESVMPSNHLILCHLLLLLSSIFPSIRVFSNESVLGIRWPKYWSSSFSIRQWLEDTVPGVVKSILSSVSQHQTLHSKD